MEDVYPEAMKETARFGLELLAAEDRPGYWTAKEIIEKLNKTEPPKPGPIAPPPLPVRPVTPPPLPKIDPLSPIRHFYLEKVPLGELCTLSIGFFKLFSDHPLVREILSRNSGKKDNEIISNASEDEVDRLAPLFNSFYSPQGLRFQITCVAFHADFPKGKEQAADDHHFRHPQMGFLFTVDRLDGSTVWKLGPNIHSYSG